MTMASHAHASLSDLSVKDINKNTWYSKYFANLRIVLLLVMTILAIGVSSFLTLPKRLNPEVKLTIVTVATILPGAGPADVETLLTNPLENKLTGVKNIDTITSNSSPNASVIIMQFLSGTDKDKARNDVQAAVNSVTSLPTDAQTPVVTALDFEDVPVWNFVLSTTASDATLMRYAEELRAHIKSLSHVDRVDIAGNTKPQIDVLLDAEKIRTLGINPAQLMGIVRSATKAYPAGTVHTDEANLAVSIDTQVTAVQDVRNLQLPVNGQPIRLGDIATVMETGAPNEMPTIVTVDHGGHSMRGVSFAVYKTASANIDTTSQEVEKLVTSEIAKQGNEFTVTSITNTGKEIGKQFSDVLSEFRSTLILVFINLFLFLGLKQALIAGITIPLTFLLSFGWMSGLNQTVNFISLFALLLAFGTSIDDTIVAVSAMTTYFSTKKFTPHETALLVWRDFVVPIWTTTITTVWAFLPLILTSGIIGEFIKPIPLVVATTMYSSTFVAWFITLPIMVFLLSPRVPHRVKVLMRIVGLAVVTIFILRWSSPYRIPLLIAVFLMLFVLNRIGKRLLSSVRIPRRSQDRLTHIINHGIINTTKLSEKYGQLITRGVSSSRGRRTILIALAVYAVVGYALLPLGFVKNEFFPKSNENVVYATLQMPVGTANDVLTKTSHDLFDLLASYKGTDTLVMETGSQINDRGGISGGGASTLYSFLLPDKKVRKETSSKIADDIRTLVSPFTEAKVTVTEVSGGPPAGSDIQIKLKGDSLTLLTDYAKRVSDFLASTPGVVNVDTSIKTGPSKLSFSPSYPELIRNGLTPDAIALFLRTNVSGFTLDTLKEDDIDKDVILRVSVSDLTPQDLTRIAIPTQSGSVPLSTLGTWTLERNPTVITHEGGTRTISVTAGVKPGYSVSDTNKKLEKFASTDLQLADGYTWQTGGVNEENTKSVQSILRAMGLSFILIMATMVIEFRSYRQAALILTLIPIAVSSVFYVFGLTGTPLSFPSLIGVMALFGVVVTNAMFIVEKINQNRVHGMPLTAAIADAGQSRLEPIILTSLTSILGLIPITFANPLWRGLGGAIISGLLFSGVIMLFYIPVIYSQVYRETD
jgi:HAE1 family hydrophobic/amphiphilic exporter-1